MAKAELKYQCRFRPGLRFANKNTCDLRRHKAKTRGGALDGRIDDYCLECSGPLKIPAQPVRVATPAESKKKEITAGCSNRTASFPPARGAAPTEARGRRASSAPEVGGPSNLGTASGVTAGRDRHPKAPHSGAGADQPRESTVPAPAPDLPGRPAMAKARRAKSKKAELLTTLAGLLRSRKDALKAARLSQDWAVAELAARDVEDMAELIVRVAG